MPPKKPFGNQDYKDRRTAAQRDRERLETDKQGQTLARRATSNPERRRLVGKLRGRRVNNPNALQVELVPRGNALDVVASSRRLLIRDADLPAAQAKLAQRGITKSAQSGNIALLDVPAAAAAGDIAALAKQLRTAGIPVSLDHVSPLGMWMKGEGGPEPTSGARPFPAVQVAQVTAPPFVAVLDSGVSNLGRTDGYLGANVNPAEMDPLDIFPAPGLLDGDAGHGSMVIGIIQQILPNVTVGSYRVADSDGVASTFDVAQKMRLAAQQGALIMNLSLGTGTEDGNPPLALLDVVDELRINHPDVLIVCAAGNEGNALPVWPAAFAATHPNVVAVAALDGAGADAGWSSHGPWVTCSTIGQGIASTYVVGKEDGPLIEDPNPDEFFAPDPWAVWSGTSFAAPQIAGAVARICAQNMGMKPAQALKTLETQATPAAVPATGYGWTVEILPGT